MGEVYCKTSPDIHISQYSETQNNQKAARIVKGWRDSETQGRAVAGSSFFCQGGKVAKFRKKKSAPESPCCGPSRGRPVPTFPMVWRAPRPARFGRPFEGAHSMRIRVMCGTQSTAVSSALLFFCRKSRKTAKKKPARPNPHAMAPLGAGLYPHSRWYGAPPGPRVPRGGP